MAISTITSEKLLHEWLERKPVSVLHFCAAWSPACGQMRSVMEELSNLPECTDVSFAEVEAESLPAVSQNFRITAVPTIIFCKNQLECDRIEGAYPSDLSKKVRQLAETAQFVAAPVETSTDLLNRRLSSLVKSHSCMVFMKGTPQSPQCGFTKQLVKLFGDHNIEYGSFNILSDEQVRQGLKEFSNWPTYPQVYVNGELVGGLDIVKELLETGELQAKLPKKSSLDDRLKQLINRSPVMIFIKGKPDQPRCGFSRTLCQILDDAKLSYDSFDILEDEEVRQGLKVYSNWPTYPQVYVNGSLIGGVDIIKELKENGELELQLKPSITS